MASEWSEGAVPSCGGNRQTGSVQRPGTARKRKPHCTRVVRGDLASWQGCFLPIYPRPDFVACSTQLLVLPVLLVVQGIGLFLSVPFTQKSKGTLPEPALQVTLSLLRSVRACTWSHHGLGRTRSAG